MALEAREGKRRKRAGISDGIEVPLPPLLVRGVLVPQPIEK
jgi:hypothetical protein